MICGVGSRTHLKNVSSGPELRCGPAQNAHILPCMLRFFAIPRLALNPDPLFLRWVVVSYLRIKFKKFAKV
jgi:hypothetical protein